ncbi:transposase [Methylobacter psychrophilus]
MYFKRSSFRFFINQRCGKNSGQTNGFLPPYSPNLNLIERLWHFIKKQVL